MSQHSQRTQRGPTGALAVGSGFLAVVSSVGAGYVLSGPGFGVRGVVGSLLGVILAGLLVTYTFDLAVSRAVAADRSRRTEERRHGRELGEETRAWQSAAVGLLNTYLDGHALNFEGRRIPDYVRHRLSGSAPAACPEPGTRSDAPMPSEPGTDRYDYSESTQPLGYQADPQRPWLPVESGQTAGPPRVAVPLPPRILGHMSLDRGWSAAETKVISRIEPDDSTQVIHPQF